MSKSWFGIDELYIVPMTDDTTSGTNYGTEIKAEGATELGISDTMENVLLEADNKILESHTIKQGGEISAANIVFSFNQIQAIKGGTVEDIIGSDGVTVVGKRYVENENDEPAYFGIVAGVHSKNAKHLIYKCKVSSFEIGANNKEHASVSFSATIVARESDGKVKAMEERDTKQAITAADLA